MRNPPFAQRKPVPGRPPAGPRAQRGVTARLVLVPLAALAALGPFTIAAFVGPAGADTASDCDAAFTTAPAAQLTYTTDPPERLARVGQTIRLSVAWDPSAWDSLTAAVACVQLNDAHDDALGTSLAGPADSGAFAHSFVVPQDVPQGSVLCTRIRLAGDPAGPATDAVWVSKTHCFEVDHEVAETPPPGDNADPGAAGTARHHARSRFEPGAARRGRSGDEHRIAGFRGGVPGALLARGRQHRSRHILRGGRGTSGRRHGSPAVGGDVLRPRYAGVPPAAPADGLRLERPPPHR
jgi:hypothetical protein